MTTAAITVYLGLGANMGDRKANLKRALDLLAQRLRIKQVSSTYETEPMGNVDQPRFLNLACQVQTRLVPEALLALAKGTEQKLGRTGKSGAPRPIDIDILLYGDQTVDSPELTIPHPKMMERGFVLVPLAQIAPDVTHPANGKTAQQLLQELKKGKQGVLPFGKG
ncbi:2-amino-4-hydroxy-6-hydroxymethyldihydropteridine diphosphokinase [Chloroflexota bacterium]